MRYLNFIWIAFLIVACNQKAENKATQHFDTLKIGNTIYQLDSIPETIYNSVKSSITEPQAPDTSFLNVYHDSITIKLPDSTLVLRNDTTVGESWVRYSYVNTFLDLGFVHIKGSYSESTFDCLISLKTGKLTYLWETPLLSPNRKLILTNSADLFASMMPNGIQLFEIKNGEIIKVFDKDIIGWMPEEIKWESDTSFLIKRAKVDNENNKYFSYRRMKIKQ